MPVVPIHESGDPFGHQDANVPFAIESAIVDGNDNLDVEIGAGRIRWGDIQFELPEGTTQITETDGGLTDDDYYVVIDFNGGNPQLNITTTPPSSNTNAEFEYLGYVTVSSGAVSSITDLRGFLPATSAQRLTDGSASSPAFGFTSDLDTGFYLEGAGSLGMSISGEGVVWENTGLTGHGVVLRTLSNPDAGDPIFEVRSSGGAVRLSVEHDGRVEADGFYTAGAADFGSLTVDSISLSGNTINVDGDIRFEEFGGLRGLYDRSIDSWRFWAGGSEEFRLNGVEGHFYSNLDVDGTAVVGALDANGDSTVAGDLTVSLIVDANEFHGDDGSATDPSFTFRSATSTGLYRDDSGGVTIVDGGNVSARFYQTGIEVGHGGSATVPGVRFGNTQTGIYEENNNFYVSVEGNQELVLGNTGFIVPNVRSNFSGGGDLTVLVEDGGQLHVDTSTQRFKSNIRAVEEDRPSILGLRGREYDKDDFNGSPRARIGLIAEDVADLWPEAARLDSDGLVLDYDDRAVLAMIIEGLHAMDERLTAAGI